MKPQLDEIKETFEFAKLSADSFGAEVTIKPEMIDSVLSLVSQVEESSKQASDFEEMYKQEHREKNRLARQVEAMQQESERATEERDEWQARFYMDKEAREHVRNEIQQLREELEHARKAAKHWQDRYDGVADRLPDALEELERIRKSGLSWMDSWRDAQVEIQSLTSQLAAKDKVLEDMQQALQSMADSDDDWYVGRVPMKEFARQTIQQVKGDT